VPTFFFHRGYVFHIHDDTRELTLNFGVSLGTFSSVSEAEREMFSFASRHCAKDVVSVNLCDKTPFLRRAYAYAGENGIEQQTIIGRVNKMNIWKPAGTNDVLEGVYLGVVEFSFPDELSGEIREVSTVALATQDKGVVAAPASYDVLSTITENFDVLVENKTVVRITFLGKQSISGGARQLNTYEIQFDGVRVFAKALVVGSAGLAKLRKMI
jgi:hypothetical protein